jgi:hypothetical protein
MILVGCCGGALMLLAGCGSRHASTEKYYLVATNVKIPYWQSANAGLMRAAQQIGVKAEMVGPGSFDPDGAGRAVAVPLATRLTFWFSHLRARQSLRTGLIQLAPGANLDQIRYRIRNATGDSVWKNIDE